MAYRLFMSVQCSRRQLPGSPALAAWAAAAQRLSLLLSRSPIVATPLAKSLLLLIGANPPAPIASAAVSGSDQSMSGASSCRMGNGDGDGDGDGDDDGDGDGDDDGDGKGTGKEEGSGVNWHDESLQLPLSSVLNSCVAHQVFAHHALSQMNWQSDSRAARGGSYLAYQSFMFLCSCSWGAAESLQLPPSSALNSFAMHQPSLLHMNWQSDARAARGGS